MNCMHLQKQYCISSVTFRAKEITPYQPSLLLSMNKKNSSDQKRNYQEIIKLNVKKILIQKNFSKVFIKADIERQKKRYNAKVMHGYYEKEKKRNRSRYRQISQFPLKEKSSCNIRVRGLFISNPRPRASNKIRTIQTGARQGEYSAKDIDVCH